MSSAFVLLWVFILAFVAHKVPEYLLEAVIGVDRLTFSTLSMIHVWIQKTSRERRQTRFQVMHGSSPFSFPLVHPRVFVDLVHDLVPIFNQETTFRIDHLRQIIVQIISGT